MLNIRKGFTAVEFAIGLTIVGILGAVASKEIAGAKRTAEMVAMKVDLRRLVVAEEVYFADSAKYTDELSGLEFQSTKNIAKPEIGTRAGGWAASITGRRKAAPARCGVGVNDENPVAPSTADGQAVCRQSK
jgi:prepilin-type N-terminal cleavage/methylation domain-containing protein